MKRILLKITILFAICTQLTAQSYHTLQSDLPCIDRDFSIVATVVTDSLFVPTLTQLELQQVVDYCNELFEPICVSFSICEFNVIPNYKFDTLRVQGPDEEITELNNKFRTDNRINAYFVSTLEGPGFRDWAFSTFGGINLYDRGYITVEKNIDRLFRIFPHELGHFFGLLNTFDNGNELVNGSNCTVAGDAICDTPADPFVLGQSTMANLTDCEYMASAQDSNGDYYLPDVCNVMSNYYSVDCPVDYFFSFEQLDQMARNYQNGPKMMW